MDQTDKKYALAYPVWSLSLEYDSEYKKQHSDKDVQRQGVSESYCFSHILS